MHVLSRIDIPVMDGSTFRTRPLTDIQRKRVKDMPTGRAPLTRWVKPINLDYIAPIPCSFVFELGHELRPAYVVNSFRKRVVLDHVLDGQTLDADRLVFTDQACGELVQKVTASISYSGMDTSHLLGRFGAVLGPLLLFRVVSLSLRQFLFVFDEEMRIADFLTSGEDHEVFQAQISPNGLLDWFKVGNLLFDQDGHEIPIRGIFGDGDGAWFAAFGKRARPTDSQWLSHLCQRQLPIAPLEGRGGILSALLMAFLLELGILGLPLEEVHKRFVQMSQGLLCGDAGHLVEPRMRFLFLQVGQHGRGVTVVYPLAVFVVGVGTLAQCPIVHETSTAKRLSKHVLLLRSRIPSVLECSFLFHTSHHSRYGVKSQQEKGRLASSPCVEAQGYPQVEIR
jgi:hypothetical protein